MLVDILATTDAAAVADSVTYLAQNNTVTLDGNLTDAPQITILWPPSVINIARVISILAGLAWVIFAVFKFLAPSSQGAGGGLMQKLGGAMPLLAGAVAVMALWDIQNTTSVLNAFMRVGYTLWSWLTSGLGNIGN